MKLKVYLVAIICLLVVCGTAYTQGTKTDYSLFTDDGLAENAHRVGDDGVEKSKAMKALTPTVYPTAMKEVSLQFTSDIGGATSYWIFIMTDIDGGSPENGVVVWTSAEQTAPHPMAPETEEITMDVEAPLAGTSLSAGNWVVGISWALGSSADTMVGIDGDLPTDPNSWVYSTADGAGSYYWATLNSEGQPGTFCIRAVVTDVVGDDDDDDDDATDDDDDDDTDDDDDDDTSDDDDDDDTVDDDDTSDGDDDSAPSGGSSDDSEGSGCCG